MELTDRQRITRAMESNVQLKRLWDEHLKLDEEIRRWEHQTYLTPLEQREIKRLKRKKLRGVDRIMMLLQHHETALAA